jgi:PadR family transcriptional regulator PadR
MTPRLTIPTLKVLNAVMAAKGQEVSGAQVARMTGLSSGTLYPILLRLERAGWLVSRWEDISPQEEGRPRRRLYLITGKGQAHANAAMRDLSAVSGDLAWAR